MKYFIERDRIGRTSITRISINQKLRQINKYFILHYKDGNYFFLIKPQYTIIHSTQITKYFPLSFKVKESIVYLFSKNIEMYIYSDNCLIETTLVFLSYIIFLD